MRTTLTLQKDIHYAIRAIAEREGLTMGQVVEAAIRERLSKERTKSRKVEYSEAGFPILPNRKKGSVVTSEHVRELLEEV
jgi:hypothetical protein